MGNRRQRAFRRTEIPSPMAERYLELYRQNASPQLQTVMQRTRENLRVLQSSGTEDMFIQVLQTALQLAVDTGCGPAAREIFGLITSEQACFGEFMDFLQRVESCRPLSPPAQNALANGPGTPRKRGAPLRDCDMTSPFREYHQQSLPPINSNSTLDRALVGLLQVLQKLQKCGQKDTYRRKIQEYVSRYNKNGDLR